MCDGVFNQFQWKKNGALAPTVLGETRTPGRFFFMRNRKLAHASESDTVVQERALLVVVIKWYSAASFVIRRGYVCV